MDFFEEFRIDELQSPSCRYASFTVILRKNKRSIDEVAVFTEQLCIAAHLEILPGKFRILIFRSIRCDRIADLIRGKLLKEGVKVYIPPFGFAELASFEIVKFIGWQLVDEFVR